MAVKRTSKRMASLMGKYADITGAELLLLAVKDADKTAAEIRSISMSGLTQREGK